jgi:hypothetical protein
MRRSTRRGLSRLTVKALAQRWHAQVGAFMETDPRLLSRSQELYLRQPEMMVSKARARQ